MGVGWSENENELYPVAHIEPDLIRRQGRPAGGGGVIVKYFKIFLKNLFFSILSFSGSLTFPGPRLAGDGRVIVNYFKFFLGNCFIRTPSFSRSSTLPGTPIPPRGHPRVAMMLDYLIAKIDRTCSIPADTGLE